MGPEGDGTGKPISFLHALGKMPRVRKRRTQTRYLQGTGEEGLNRRMEKKEDSKKRMALARGGRRPKARSPSYAVSKRVPLLKRFSGLRKDAHVGGLGNGARTNTNKEDR